MFKFLNKVMIELKWRRLLVVLANARQSYHSHMVTLQKFPALLLLFVS